MQRILTEGLWLLKLCCSDICAMAYALHPSLLDHYGLEPAIQSHVKSLMQHRGIEVGVDIPPGFGRVPAEVELALFRIMQGALSNICRAGKKKVAVRVFRNALEVGLEVTHEGSEIRPPEGQTPEDSTPGAAMAGMRERVRMLGGRLEITSARDNKTTVRALLPLIPCQSE